MIKKISQNIGKIIRNFQGIPRKGEFTIEQYNSFLCNKYDTMYVNLLSNVLHKHLTENEIKTSLIGVGSTISGISTNNNSSFYSENSDIDLKLIINNQNQSDQFYNALNSIEPILKNNFINVKNHMNINRMPGTKHTDDYMNFGYDKCYIIKPPMGKKLDLIVKNTCYLTAKDHIHKEREKNNAFVILYQDK